LRKSMVVLAISFALGGSALSTSAFARSSFGSGRPAGHAYDSDRVGNLHRGLLHRNRRGYEGDPWGRRGYGPDPWGHWGAYYGPMI
jgi:hypothetical protein